VDNRHRGKRVATRVIGRIDLGVTAAALLKRRELTTS
jgi:hypothetical protein